MSVLLDTNIVSELRKGPDRIDPNVAAWAETQRLADHWLSVITIMELAIGVARIARRDPVQGDRLRAWLDTSVISTFRTHILPIDLPVALIAAGLHTPNPGPERDTLIAATAIHHHLTIATRNTKDFDRHALSTINPWDTPREEPPSPRESTGMQPH
ncbi:MAG: type II toxin-antitoxin system VapC family toxin [Bifidobacteriaceae bacterium]|nr:type II toxin-antitoxin system VapC family toxin [Bifidobacteriaceae bacterium]